MKATKILLSITLMTLISVSTSLAQDFKGGVKIYPFSLLTGKIALQGEYILNSNQSVTLDLSRRSISISQGLLGNLIADNIDQETSGEYSSFQISPSFRRYSKKKEGPRGSYFSPGLRFATTNMDLIIDLDEFQNSAVSVSSNLFGLNLDFGSQWLIGDRVSIDWNIIGLGIQFGSLKGSVTSSSLSNEDAAELARDLNEEIEGIPLVNIEFEADGNTVSTNTKLILPVLRTRLSIGVFF